MRSANLFFFTQPQEMFEAWYQAQQNTSFEEKEEQFFIEFQQKPINYGTITDTAYQDSLYWKEQHLYGSSRLGIAKPELEVTNFKNSNFSMQTSNFKNYELTNHLGNVLSTIKDEKQQIDQNADGIVDYYEPIVITANDYYPFGMLMPNRSFSLAGSGYRFGFNTQEKDDEVYGKGNLMTAKFWEYDARIGRRWNEDPVVKEWESPYLVNGGNPIWYFDILGDDKEQRNKGVAKAKEHSDANKKQDRSMYKMGAKNAKPGEPIDCSGLMSQAAKAGGEPDPNRGVKTSGVLNIESNTQEVSKDKVEVGNFITFRAKKGYPYHIGIVSYVKKEKDGSTKLKVIHSSGSKGAHEDSWTIGDGSTYDKITHGFFKWDTKPDKQEIKMGKDGLPEIDLPKVKGNTKQIELNYE